MLAQKKDQTPSASPYLAAAYALLIVYGSLYPFSDWLPADEIFAFLTGPWPRYLIRSDIITNLLIYLPLGLMTARALRHRRRPAGAIVTATLICLLLSFAMESLQSMLPDRVSSRLDLLLNTLGGLGGALLARLTVSPPGPLRRLAALRREWFLPGRAIDLGLWALGLWALSQLTPLLLSLDTHVLRKSLLPLWTPGFPSPFNWPQLAAYVGTIAGLGLFTSTLVRHEKNICLPFIAFVSSVLLIKVLVMGRYLSLETMIGAAMGLVLAVLLRRSGKPLRLILGSLLLLGGFALTELEPAAGALAHQLQPFNWVPFRGQMHSLAGFSEILSLFWPFLAAGCLAAFATRPGQRRLAAFFGGIVVLALIFALEWQQQTIAGQHADITDILLALAGWSLPWWWRIHTSRGEPHGQPGRA